MFSGAQLAFRLNEMRRSETVQAFIEAILQNDNRIHTPDEAVEAALLFQRNWASFAFPRFLRALDAIQREIFSHLGESPGDYSYYASQVESLFLPAEIPALEEYGIPIQVGLKIRRFLSLGAGLDQTLASLAALDINRAPLSEFERGLVKDARAAL